MSEYVTMEPVHLRSLVTPPLCFLGSARRARWPDKRKLHLKPCLLLPVHQDTMEVIKVVIARPPVSTCEGHIEGHIEIRIESRRRPVDYNAVDIQKFTNCRAGEIVRWTEDRSEQSVCEHTPS